MNDIIRVDIYVTDIKQREEVWKAAANSSPRFSDVHARGGAGTRTPQLLVEVNAIGFLGGSTGA